MKKPASIYIIQIHLFPAGSFLVLLDRTFYNKYEEVYNSHTSQKRVSIFEAKRKREKKRQDGQGKQDSHFS